MRSTRAASPGLEGELQPGARSSRLRDAWTATKDRDRAAEREALHANGPPVPSCKGISFTFDNTTTRFSRSIARKQDSAHGPAMQVQPVRLDLDHLLRLGFQLRWFWAEEDDDWLLLLSDPCSPWLRRNFRTAEDHQPAVGPLTLAKFVFKKRDHLYLRRRCTARRRHAIVAPLGS